MISPFKSQYKPERHRQGRCWNCKVRFVWSASLAKVREVYCPTCGEKLERTTSDYRPVFWVHGYGPPSRVVAECSGLNPRPSSRHRGRK